MRSLFRELLNQAALISPLVYTRLKSEIGNFHIKLIILCVVPESFLHQCYSILRHKVAFGCDNLDPPDQLHQWNVISKRVTGKVCRMTRQSRVITDHWTLLCCVFTVLHYNKMF